jgi:hypothetical protein
LSLAATKPFGHTITDTVYYGEGSGTFTVTATMTDSLAGLDEVVFPTTTDNGQSYDLAGATNATQAQAHGYEFAQASNFGGTVDVVMSDRAGNETAESFTIVNDTVAPAAAITVPERAGLSFVVEWSGFDPSTSPSSGSGSFSGQGSGIRGYEV